MPPVTIGRVGYRISVPPDSQRLHVFLDAGGRAGEVRVWAGLAVFGDDELAWVEDVLAEIRAERGESEAGVAEVKGRDVSLEVAQAIGRRIRDEDHRIAFWASRHPAPGAEAWTAAASDLGTLLDASRADEVRIDQIELNHWYCDMAAYYRKLKPVNRHKIVAIISHLQWLFDGLRSTGTAACLAEVRVLIDREDFPRPVEACAKLIKAFVSAGLQAAGMSFRGTGRAPRESAEEGAISVNIHADSSGSAALQLTDILLQVVQARLLPAR